MAIHERVDSLTRGFDEQLSSVVIASSFFLKGSKPVRGGWDCPVQWDSSTCLESPRGGGFCLFSKISSSGSEQWLVFPTVTWIPGVGCAFPHSTCQESWISSSPRVRHSQA